MNMYWFTEKCTIYISMYGLMKLVLNKVDLFSFLKGVFAKNESGYRLNAIKKRF